ncbi:tRNA wybutosine-synthesizing protein 3 homolog isoform X3 [Tachypleus tridentatus]|uniref:tRNA wybutosine-synthesizing protein 3 homolog isoform X3 n=1 Tax=Tachypleus tridentatus TaxID=6853 RepID=UPI003FD305FC
MALSFKERKERRLNGPDLSRKKSIDKHIKHLVELINKEEVYCTASSCSGRVVLVARTDTEDGQVQKKGCKWLLVSHNVVDWNDFVGHLRNKEGSIVMKFEPMIMHVQCATLTDAQKLHATSLASGFKNSGLTISNSGNITLYVKFIVGEANKKMFENQKRIERLSSNIQIMLNKKHAGASKQTSREVQSHNSDDVKSQVETEEHRLECDCCFRLARKLLKVYLVCLNNQRSSRS